MHYRTNSAIVLRKIGGRLQACWAGSRVVAGGVSTGGAAVPSLAGLVGMFLMLLIPAVAIAAAAVVGLKLLAPIAIASLGVKGLALATGPAVVDVKAIKDEILGVVAQFKEANDKELAEIKKEGTASAETKTLVNRLNDAITELQAKVTRMTLGGGDLNDKSGLSPEARAKLNAFFRPTEDERDRKATLNLAFPNIQAAQGVGSAGAGAAIVAPDFSNRLEKALLFYSGMMQNSEVVTTDTGVDLPWPTVNDTTQVGAILAENTAIGAQDVTFSSVTLKAYKYTSKLIAVSWELLQDSAFNIEGMVADLAGERVGRILNTHFSVGTGTGQPNGAATAATSGKVGIAGQTTSVIYDDLVDLIHSVDVAYRIGAKFMLADSSLKVIRKIKDSQGRPLWEPSLQAGMPDTILGYPVVVNNDIAAMGVNAKSILFGDFSRYKVRRVKEVQLVRLNERYADSLQTGFFAFCRFDGNLINAGTNPLKYYQNSAT